MTQVSQALITEPNTPVNLTGARDGPPPQRWQTPPETERWPVNNVSVAEPEQNPAPLVKKHFSATEIHKDPSWPVFTEIDVEYTKRDDLWCATLGGFAVNELKELFIYDAPWTPSRKWDGPIKRASRWLPNDYDMLSFYAQLMHRGLPLTRAHEVAKWRMKTRTIRQRQLIRPGGIVKTLGDFLDATIDKLRRGVIPDGSSTHVTDEPVTSAEDGYTLAKVAARWRRSYAEYSGDVQKWMEETGPRLLEGMTSYNRVMHKWLDVRSRVPEPVAPPPSPPIKVKPQLVSPNCLGCDLHLRTCECPFCMVCGELTDDCDCVECKLCHEVTDDGACECEECYECSEWMNEDKKIFCECYCRECEERFEYSEYNGVEDGCGCRIEWRRKGQYAEEVRAARDARRAKRDARKAERRAARKQQQKENYPKNRQITLQKWIKQHRPGYWQEGHQSADTKIDLGDVSGTYQLFSRERTNVCREKEDLSITTKNTLMRGRYRYSEYVNGLFFGGVVPTQASTSVVPCRVAIEDFESRNGDWWYDYAPTNDHEEESPDNTDGIMFLGGGLIKVSPHFFAHINGRIGNAVFGIKINDYCEDFDALKESWDAIHDEFATDRRGARGIRKVPVHPECDETLIHDLVDRLWREPDPPSPKDSIGTRFIARNMGMDYGEYQMEERRLRRASSESST